MTVGDICTRNVAVAPKTEMIVDADGALAGILTLDDVLQYLTAQQSGLVALVAREQRRERQYRV